MNTDSQNLKITNNKNTFSLWEKGQSTENEKKYCSR